MLKEVFEALEEWAKAPQRNRDLIAEYLGGHPTDLFYQLAKKYEVPLEGFVG